MSRNVEYLVDRPYINVISGQTERLLELCEKHLQKLTFFMWPHPVTLLRKRRVQGVFKDAHVLQGYRFMTEPSI